MVASGIKHRSPPSLESSLRAKSPGQVENCFMPDTGRSLHSYVMALILLCLNKAKVMFLESLHANILFIKITLLF